MRTYWTTRDGKKITVDEVDELHLRNALKMIINKEHRKEKKRKFTKDEEFKDLNEYLDYKGE